MTVPEHPAFRFGEFRLEPHERRLFRRNESVLLTPKAFDMLVLLVEHAGHVLSKDELLDALWQGRPVTESNLTKHIWMLRRALGESDDGVRYIETVSKRGYRFVSPVASAAIDDADAHLNEVVPADAQRGAAQLQPHAPAAPGPIGAPSQSPCPLWLIPPARDPPAATYRWRLWLSVMLLVGAVAAAFATWRHGVPAAAPKSIELIAETAVPVPISTARGAKSPIPSIEVVGRMDRAVDLLRIHDAAAARDELLEVIAAAPGYSLAYLYLAQAWPLLGNRAKALAAAEQAAAHEQDLAPPLKLRIAAQHAIAESWTGPSRSTA